MTRYPYLHAAVTTLGAVHDTGTFTGSRACALVTDTTTDPAGLDPAGTDPDGTDPAGTSMGRAGSERSVPGRSCRTPDPGWAGPVTVRFAEAASWSAITVDDRFDRVAILRRRIAAAFRDPARSPFRTGLVGAAETVTDDDGTVTVTAWTIDGGTASVTSPAHGGQVGSVCRVGSWQTEPGRLPGELRNGFVPRPIPGTHIHRLADTVGCDHGDVHATTRAILRASRSEPAPAGIDPDVWSVLGQVCADAVDLHDLLDGTWVPKRNGPRT